MSEIKTSEQNRGPDIPAGASFIGMSKAEITGYVLSRGFRAFHANQLFAWVYQRQIDDFSLMSDIPRKLRENLSTDFSLHYYTPCASSSSADGSTTKHVFMTDDRTGIEVVVLRAGNARTSFCISSQLGCAVGCSYCATGAAGYIRNLSAGEVVNQVLSLERLHGKPDSILYMGMGEPLLNYDAVLKSIGLLIDAGFSSRRITISTCGIVKRIYDLARSGLRPRLAVSIGSVFEKKRKTIVPLSSENSLSRLKQALQFYRETTKRRVTFEYTLMAGINDSEEDAVALARFARDVNAHVNIIRYNRTNHREARREIQEADLQLPRLQKPRIQTPVSGQVAIFRQILSSSGVQVSERYRRGNDIAAACGQLVWHPLS